MFHWIFIHHPLNDRVNDLSFWSLFSTDGDRERDFDRSRLTDRDRDLLAFGHLLLLLDRDLLWSLLLRDFGHFDRDLSRERDSDRGDRDRDRGDLLRLLDFQLLRERERDRDRERLYYKKKRKITHHYLSCVQWVYTYMQYS